ncbi:potassium channel protein kcv [Paramecium bursaria Chlorella virus NE-JV-1]|nr:potassium channel protein kcv [Paramecium bursaria Chlorella virus NE-JV-1]
MSILTIHFVVLLLFATLYKFFPGGFENNFKRGDGSKEPVSWVDAIYVSTATHTTTGFGDIVADSRAAKFAVTCHMLIVFSIVVLGIKPELLTEILK